MHARVAGAGITGISIEPVKSFSGKDLYKVRIGSSLSLAEIDTLVVKLRQLEILDFKLLRDN